MAVAPARYVRPDKPKGAPRASAAGRGYGTDWQQLRRAAKQAMPYVCVDCSMAGDDAAPYGRLHLDHVVPKSRGGADELSNLRWRCRVCHGRKGVRHDGLLGNPLTQ